jgi:hypothetical protein
MYEDNLALFSVWFSNLEQENGQLNETCAPDSKMLPNYRKCSLVKTGPLIVDPQWTASEASDWVLELFPDIWKHLELVEAAEQSSEEEGTDIPHQVQQPWILLRKDNRRFAIVRTCGDPDGWDLLQVRSKGRSTSDDVMLYLGMLFIFKPTITWELLIVKGTRIPIPSDIYEAENWLDTPPLPRQKSHGKKRKRTETWDSEEGSDNAETETVSFKKIQSEFCCLL